MNIHGSRLGVVIDHQLKKPKMILINLGNLVSIISLSLDSTMASTHTYKLGEDAGNRRNDEVMVNTSYYGKAP